MQCHLMVGKFNRFSQRTTRSFSFFLFKNKVTRKRKSTKNVYEDKSSQFSCCHFICISYTACGKCHLSTKKKKINKSSSLALSFNENPVITILCLKSPLQKDQ